MARLKGRHSKLHVIAQPLRITVIPSSLIPAILTITIIHIVELQLQQCHLLVFDVCRILSSVIISAVLDKLALFLSLLSVDSAIDIISIILTQLKATIALLFFNRLFTGDSWEVNQLLVEANILFDVLSK